MNSVYKWVSKHPVIILILLAITSRLPQLLSDNLYFDGDECIVGLMAKHFIEGKETPLFFYGQNYGFSFIEVLAIGLFYVVFGVSIISIKLAMLSLWTLGILFFYFALKNMDTKNRDWIPLLITIVFILSPSFVLWSMKARGGYLTAFFLTSLVLYLNTIKKWDLSLMAPFFSGLILTIIYQSQPLWLAGLIPIIIYVLIEKRNKKNVLMHLTGILAGIFLFFLLKLNISNFWSPDVLSWSNFNWKTLFSIPNQIYTNMAGSYYYTRYIEPHFLSQLLGFVFTVLVVVLLTIGIVFLLKKKPINKLFFVGCFSIIITLSYLMLMEGKDFRYLLPLTGYTLFTAYVLLANINNQKIISYFLITLIFMGAYSVFSFKNYNYTDNPAKASLVKELKSRNIDFVFSEGGLLQWEVMFHTKEKIIARYKNNVDRYPKYIKQVDEALNNPKSKIALIGYYDEGLISSSAQFIPINQTFFIYENPSKEMLRERGFKFEE